MEHLAIWLDAHIIYILTKFWLEYKSAIFDFCCYNSIFISFFFLVMTSNVCIYVHTYILWAHFNIVKKLCFTDVDDLISL